MRPEFTVEPGAKLTVKRVFQRLNAFLSDETIVVGDIGDARFGATDLFIHRRTEFLGLRKCLAQGTGLSQGRKISSMQRCRAAEADTTRLSVVDVRLDPMDRSPALERLAERLSKKI